MGADIHGPFVEVESPHGFWLCEAELIWHRDYDLFSLMAGVRTSSTELEPLFAPRGIPHDASGMVLMHRGDPAEYTDCHSHSWLSAEELAAVIEAYPTTVFAGAPAGTPVDVPFQARLALKFMADVSAMWAEINAVSHARWQAQYDEIGRHPGWPEPPVGPPPVRISFCFDN